MIELTCHCSNVTIQFAELPAKVRDCDCPICNRLGALWGDFAPDDVKVTTLHEPTKPYVWEDNAYALHHCPTCGCSTHYTDIETTPESQVGVNLRMLDRRKLELIPIA